jgi:hypothetical protein
MRVGLGPIGIRVWIPLDPDNGQDDDGCGFVRRITSEAHDAPVVGEFDNVAHQPLSFAAGKRAICPNARYSASP